MILPNPKDAVHKAQMYRLLTAIIDNDFLRAHCCFKGGTAAAMLGFLDRFSIDLDFDLKGQPETQNVNRRLEKIFEDLQLEIKQKSIKTCFYVLKYQSNQTRNTLKLSLLKNEVMSNIYKPLYLSDISRYVICQTKETIFANKLVAITDRYKKYKTIAGRDIYDSHYFFLQGFGYNKKVIEERTGKSTKQYLNDLINFIEKKVTDKIVTEDLNFLVPREKFRLIRKVLKQEIIMFLGDEIKRL